MKSARKRKHSPVAFDETAASSVLTETDTDTQKKRMKNAINGVSFAIVQDASASAEVLPPSTDTAASSVTEPPHAPVPGNRTG
ncbi:hypothetical protein AVEN_185177-1 [Araneus ventricosus]|uniref:Uncharacterized protein n=1 Tax=Araneus ventricosus TaxID=182803 RepID=A0A4Y2AQI1_ARAVE|nr:hypothetical protein AVEN_185177-1 [Araneus ventricosus]